MIDELAVIEGEIKELEGAIRTQARNLKKEARTFAKAKADYAEKDAKEKVLIYEKEIEEGLKTTDAIRAAKALQNCGNLYRLSKEAEYEYESTKDVLEALQTELSGKQTRAGLFKSEWGLAGRQTP